MKTQKTRLLLLIVLLLSSCYQAAPLPQITPTSVPATSTILPTTEPEPLPSATPVIEPTNTSLPAPTLPPDPTELAISPPGIILFIGDGMGAAHRQAAAWLTAGAEGSLVMDSLSTHGLAQTASADDPITDSAAGATAMATGHLTNNEYLGVDPDGNRLETILEMAKAQGWSVGLITTVPLAHATPAAFAVHHPDRNDYPEIAELIIAAQIDVLLGGGEDDFHAFDQAGCFPGGGHQPQDNDLVQIAAADGYTTICSREELLNLNTTGNIRLLGLFAAEEMQAPFQPSLAEMTQTALAILSQDPDGFFLMVEAGQIDWAAHDNRAKSTIQHTVDLDTAVTYGRIFALGRPETLLIVAADHETGGMSLNLDGNGSSQQDGPYHMPDGTPFWVDWQTRRHTGDAIPVTAEGPYAELLAGEYHLTRLFEVMRMVVEGE